MKDIYHVCLTAHNEVLIRDFEDARNFTNLMALSAFRCGGSILADALMSNHAHFILLIEKPWDFAVSMKISMTKHFNHAHSRNGKLFDKKVFIRKLEGTKHIMMAMNYCLRNGLHHGQSETAFAYPYGSCNSLFAGARGIGFQKLITNRNEINSYLPKNAEFPDSFAMKSDGTLDRSSFEEIRMAESWYGTPNSFIYNMNRRTTEEWIKEQESDDNKCEPITLNIIEKGVNFETEAEMLKNEGGARSSSVLHTDQEICNLIDCNIIHRYRRASIYQLDYKQRSEIAAELIGDLRVRAVQAARCTAIPVSSLPPEFIPKNIRIRGREPRRS